MKSSRKVNINRFAYNKNDIQISMFIGTTIFEIDITNLIESISFNKAINNSQYYGMEIHPYANISGRLTASGSMTVYTPFMDVIDTALYTASKGIPLTPRDINLLTATQYLPISIHLNYISQNGLVKNDFLSNIHFNNIGRSINNNIETVTLDFNITSLINEGYSPIQSTISTISRII